MGVLERFIGLIVDIELMISFVGEGYVSSVEDIGFDVKFMESEGLYIEFVDISFVVRVGIIFGDEGDFVGDGFLSDEWVVDIVD